MKATMCGILLAVAAFARLTADTQETRGLSRETANVLRNLFELPQAGRYV